MGNILLTRFSNFNYFPFVMIYFRTLKNVDYFFCLQNNGIGKVFNSFSFLIFENNDLNLFCLQNYGIDRRIGRRQQEVAGRS
jgi:hypothetical protein